MKHISVQFQNAGKLENWKIYINIKILVFHSQITCYKRKQIYINPLNAKLSSICHLLALLGALHILHVSRIRVN